MKHQKLNHHIAKYTQSNELSTCRKMSMDLTKGTCCIITNLQQSSYYSSAKPPLHHISTKRSLYFLVVIYVVEVPNLLWLLLDHLCCFVSTNSISSVHNIVIGNVIWCPDNVFSFVDFLPVRMLVFKLQFENTRSKALPSIIDNDLLLQDIMNRKSAWWVLSQHTLADRPDILWIPYGDTLGILIKYCTMKLHHC